MIGRVGHVSSYHLGSLLDAVELTVECAFVCKGGYFNAQVREPMLYKLGGFHLLASLEECN